MKISLKHRILSLVLAVVTFMSVLPVQSVSATGYSSTNYGANIGSTAKFDLDASSRFLVCSDPFSFDYDVDWDSEDYWLNVPTNGDSDIPEDHLFVIIDYYWDEASTALWYKVEAAPGSTLPEKMISNDYYWVFQDYTDEELSAGDLLVIYSAETYICDENGNPVESVGVPTYGSTFLTAESTLQGDVKYQWQICYDAKNDLWVDIYGEDSSDINLSYGMVASLADEDGFVTVRCKTTSGSLESISAVIETQITETELPEDNTENDSENDTVEYPLITKTATSSITTSEEMSVDVDVNGEMPESAVLCLSEADPIESVPEDEEILLSLDMYIIDALDNICQPTDGESFTIEILAESLGLESGDYYVVYHEHNGSVKVYGPYLVDSSYISFEIDGFSRFTFTRGCEPTVTEDDFSDNIDHIATVNNSSYDYIVTHSDPSAITQYIGAWWNASVYTGDDIESDFEFVITDVYVSSAYPNALWYKVKAADGYTLPEIMESNPWVFQDYTANGWADTDSLIISEETEVTENVISSEATTSTGETVSISVQGNIPENSTLSVSEIESTVSVAENEELLISLDITVRDSEGNIWQPDSGETVTVTLPAESLGISDGDYYVVYSVHEEDADPEVLGPYLCENGTVTFTVGNFSEFAFALADLDYSENVGKYATFNAADCSYFPYSEVEPESGWESTVTQFSVEDFSEDLVMEVSDYYILEADYISLWYAVSVSEGSFTEEMPETFWVFQNYIGDEAYEFDSLILSDPVVETPEEPTVEITVDGVAVIEVEVSTSEKVTLTATPNIEGSSTNYKWQLLIPSADMWVDISGQTSADCIVNYGIVANRLDSDGKAHIRCVTTVDSQELISASIAVVIVETAAEASDEPTDTVFFDNYTFTGLSKSFMGLNGSDSVSDPVTVKIQFVYGSDPTKLVDEPIVSTIQKGTSYQLLDYTLPVLEGYSAYFGDDTNTIYTEVDIQLDNIQEDTTITFKYWPAKVNYTVIYYWQNADNDNYTEHERVVMTDFTGQMTTVEDRAYDGFYQLLYEKVPIASDGSTVIEVYYDRYYYLMLFNLDGGYGVQPVYARHGATLNITAPTKAGCDFVGWDSDADSDDLADGDFPTTMPIGDTSYTAVWEYSHDKVDVHIVVWGENPNDEEYSYVKSETIQVAPGTEINYKENILICSVEEHTHSDSCGYSCGKEEHSHDSCTLICSVDIHTHGMSCYENVGSQDSPFWDTPSNPSNGEIYYINAFWGETYKYIYINGIWYSYTGTLTSGSVASPICGKTESTHTHSDSCYNCGKEAHSHDSCNYACDKNEHQHSEANGCYASDDLMDSALWTLVESDTVTVAPDGSTILNVYYDRTTRTLTFKYDYSYGDPQKTMTITDKWGADISDEYDAVVEASGTTFWTENSRGNVGPYTNYFGIMPKEHATYYNNGVNGDSGSMQYWGQDLNGEYTVDLFTTPNVGGFTVTSEDRYEFEGFEYSHGTSNEESCSGATFYYNRKTYTLEFHDNGEQGVLSEYTKTVYYEAPLSSYGNIVLTADDAPAKYEPGSVEFVGWYTNPEGAGEPFDFANEIMPANNIILYAKWAPVTHTVRFYTDKSYVGTDTVYTNSNGEKYIYEVAHGSKLQDPHIPPNDPQKGQYEFAGWYYIDAQGGEQRWDFENTTVTRDVDVYAKWSSNKLMPYTVKYVYEDENGNKIEIAEPTTGSALGGNSKTFEAKGNEQLYEDYQEGYFPTTQSHTITIDLENTANNEFTFYYKKVDAVPYTVYYVTETLAENGTSLGTVELNGATYYIISETKTVSDNKKAIVTETYVPIAGYLPNNYQETLVINPDPAEDNPNQIIFIYSVDEENSMYVVHYYFQDVTGTKYVEDSAYLFQSKAKIGSTVNAAILTVDNFTHNSNVSGTELNGTVEQGKILELHVYYDRNTYPYKVQYFEKGTLKILSEEKKVTGKYWDSIVTEDALAIDGYTLVSDDQVSIQIRKDTEDPTVNIITFYYTKSLTSLTITKEGAEDIDINQSFMFKVTGGNLPPTGLIVVTNPGNKYSVTITGLTVGVKYTVEELTDWSWRYEPDDEQKNPAEITLSATSSENVVTFKNKRSEEQWLDGDSYCDNMFYADGIDATNKSSQN